MLTTRHLVNDYKEVPSQFIFQYYLELHEKLHGQELTMKSIFNEKDTNPSMSLYVDKKTETYKWKDFSTGKGGNPINLVMELKGLNFNQAALLIVNDYNNYKLSTEEEDEIEFKRQAKFQVSDHKIRKWNINDKDYWTGYHIGSSFLNNYCVKPLSEYTLSKKEDDGSVYNIVIKAEYLYGYFTKSGELYKIYQPKNRDRKFIKIKNHLQGSEQIEGHDILIVQSGIKDIGAMKSLDLKVDCIAPDSENIMLLPGVVKRYRKTHKWIFVMFDNDPAGIEAMKKYRDQYGMNCLLLTYAKDIADAVKEYGPDKVRQKVISLIELKTFAIK